MITRSILIGALVLQVLALPAAWGKTPNIPSSAKIEVRRSMSSSRFHAIRVEFQWSKDNPPNFSKGEAAEFQVHINPKCFAQPQGGKDDDHSLVFIKHNLPDEAVPYRDVWNYWIPESADDLISRSKDSCGDLNWLEKKAIKSLWDSIRKKYEERNYAGFAIGVKHADQLKPEVSYRFDYPIDIPVTKECLSFFDPKSNCRANQANAGGAQISMQYFSNTCQLTPVFGKTFDCAEFLGLSQCSSGDGETRDWLRRLCVPTGILSFTPRLKEFVDWSHTECCDDDADGVFAIQSLPMFGTSVGDCNDRNATIKNERYDTKTGQCMAMPPDCAQICQGDGKDCGAYRGCDCGSCSGNQICTANVCSSCGGAGELCCPGQSCSGSLVCDNASNRCRVDNTPLLTAMRFVDQCGHSHWQSTTRTCYPGSMSPTQGCFVCMMPKNPNAGCLPADATCWIRESDHAFSTYSSNPGYGNFSKISHCFESGANAYTRGSCMTAGDPPDIGWIADMPVGKFNKPVTLCRWYTGHVWEQFFSRLPNQECTQANRTILTPNPFGYVQ